MSEKLNGYKCTRWALNNQNSLINFLAHSRKRNVMLQELFLKMYDLLSYYHFMCHQEPVLKRNVPMAPSSPCLSSHHQQVQTWCKSQVVFPDATSHPSELLGHFLWDLSHCNSVSFFYQHYRIAVLGLRTTLQMCTAQRPEPFLIPESWRTG